MRFQGPNPADAGIFVLKDDATADDAWLAALQLAAAEGGARVEHHRTRNTFVEGLGRWFSVKSREHALLCVYAHAGVRGIAPTSTARIAETLSWPDFAGLIQPIGVLWLVGCKTEHAVSVPSLASLVKRRLLVTTEAAPWLPFLSSFRAEISLNPITFFDEMPEFLRRTAPLLAAATRYLRPSGADWKEET